jgi:wyosine [tRNA(Phe)-imidazoG37] synthetase (radical SAM superfamily)
MTTDCKYVYGPVASRRLGRSLGVDLVPFKTCTYDCIYCQLGRTTHKTIKRKEYVSVDKVLAELERKLGAGPAPDYISLAGSGEPTLNFGIGDLIGKIKGLTRIPLAVLTNGSLLWIPEVQEALLDADLVLPSLDAGDESLFQYVNRPHQGIAFERMVDGIAEFTRRFKGKIWLEIFLLGGVTGIDAEAAKIAERIRRIRPARVQLNTISRPPAEEFAFPLSPDRMRALKGFFPGKVDLVSGKRRYDTPRSGFNKPGEADILALLGRRPCTADGIAQGLGIRVIEALKLLEALCASGEVHTVVEGGRCFYTASGRKHAYRA